MARRRGFLAELAHQQQVAARNREKAARAAQRQHAAAVRQAEQARRQAERAQAQATRAAAAERKRAEAEAKRLHVEAMEAEVASLNADLTADADEISSILSATLDVDDHVDLEQLRVVAEHPPFPRTDLEQPIPPPHPIQAPPEPQYIEPPAPSGLSGALGGKKKHAQAVAHAQAAYQAQYQAWQHHVSQIPAQQLAQMQEHQRQETARQEQLTAARATYDAECASREAEAAASNTDLDALIAGLAAGEEEAVQEYVAIVLGESVYPDCFPVAHQFTFDSSLGELDLTVTIPPPTDLSDVKAFKYTKSADEITSSKLSQKDQKDRYASALHQVALRSLHEVFEADRDGRIKTISLLVATDSIDAGTGKPKRTALVAVAAERDSFMDIDLSNVVPLATLEHLNAQVSKNPFGLVAIDTSKGVRSSGT